MNTTLRCNEDDLVEMAVTGQISQPAMRPNGYVHHPDGRAEVLPGMYGVVYNARVGDRAFGWTGDHVEPGVSIANSDDRCEFALHYLSCIGNTAVVTTGLARGERGIVTGEHARLLVHFTPDVLDRLTIGDHIQIQSVGRGLCLADFPDIEFKKTSPALFRQLSLELVDGRVQLPVAMELPIEIMGSGAELNSEYVDQDLMSGDRELMAERGIDKMRLGDLIAIRHADHHFGRSYRQGMVSIALCIHGDSIMTGHGPGILTLMCGHESKLDFRLDKSANIAHYFGIGAAA